MAQTKDLTEGNPLSLIIKFALPLLGGILFQQAYNIADAAIVGRYLGAKALAAVGASSSAQFLTFGSQVAADNRRVRDVVGLLEQNSAQQRQREFYD